MTKKEFQTMRNQYRRVCRDLYQQAEARARDEFVLSDTTIILYDGLRETVLSFAAHVGCRPAVAVDILNFQ